MQDKVNILAGFGLTPLALATAPVATEAKVPMVVMAAATSIIPDPLAVHRALGFTLPQVTAPIAEWALKNNIKRVVTMVTDYGPGLDAEKTFVKRFTEGGGDDRREHPHAAAESGLRAVPAAREGRQAGRAVRVRALRARARR